MVNEKCRDAVTDLYLLIDSRDISRIGTVLKNPLEMSTVSAASLAAFFLKRRDSVAWEYMVKSCHTYHLTPAISSISRS